MYDHHLSVWLLNLVTKNIHPQTYKPNFWGFYLEYHVAYTKPRERSSGPSTDVPFIIPPDIFNELKSVFSYWSLYLL